MKLWSNGKTAVRVAKVYKAIRQQLDWSIALFRAKTANDRVYLKVCLIVPLISTKYGLLQLNEK